MSTTGTDLLVLQAIAERGGGAVDEANIDHGFLPVEHRNAAQVSAAVDRLAASGHLAKDGIHWVITDSGRAVVDAAEDLLNTYTEWAPGDPFSGAPITRHDEEAALRVQSRLAFDRG